MTRVCFTTPGAISGIVGVIDMVVECRPSMAVPGSQADPRDRAADWAVTEHHPQVPVIRRVEVRFKVPERSSRLAPFADKLSR